MDLFQKMMKIDPAKRLTLTEVQAHPWMLGEVPTKRQMREEFAGRKALIDEIKRR